MLLSFALKELDSLPLQPYLFYIKLMFSFVLNEYCYHNVTQTGETIKIIYYLIKITFSVSNTNISVTLVVNVLLFSRIVYNGHFM